MYRVRKTNREPRPLPPHLPARWCLVSRRRPKPRPRHPVARRLFVLDGKRVPGGCHNCDAYQTITAQPVIDGYAHINVTGIRVYHDPWCPRMTQATPAGAADRGDKEGTREW